VGNVLRSALSLLFAGLSIPTLCVAQELTTSAGVDGPRVALDRATIARVLSSGLIKPSPDAPAVSLQQTSTKNWAAEGRACEGCPRRRVWAAYMQSGIINVFYNIGNHARGEETAKVTFKTWWANMKYGFEWDDNPFTTNQFGHPYQGSNYYTGGRANGLSYWESAALTAFGSATWEYFGENNYASFNDLINTTLGGIALGETFHRAAWMIRDTTKADKGRFWQEIVGTIIDPVGGVNRFISGDSSRVSEKPKEFVPSASDVVGSFGLLWQGNNDNAFSETPKVFLEMDLNYGKILEGRSRSPFEAFTVSLRLGGGKGISDIRVRGRLLGQPLGKLHLMLAQSYDYVANPAYEFGRQGFDFILSKRVSLGSRTDAMLSGGAGVTPIGAIDRVAGTEPVEPEPEEGTETEGGARSYDYGPGTAFGGRATFSRSGRSIFDVSYHGYQLYVVDGVRSNHVIQRFRMDLNIPIRGRLAAGLTGEYFYRKTYFTDGTERRDKFPQVRIYLAWR
jgi:Domain of unknown function (DUF3943)